MIVRKLFLKNIRSYEEAELVFPEGSILLAGDVGSGKTTLLLAIEYALFGLQPGQRGSALLRNGADEGEVALTCTIGEQTVLIERSLKRDTKGVSNEYAAVTINGSKEECSITELKTKILALLGYPEEFIKKNNVLYKYTIYTPQEHMKQIILEDPETRLSILRHIFGINKYKRMRENLALYLTFSKDELKIVQAEIRLFERYTEERKQNLLEQASLEQKILSEQRKLEEKKREHQRIEKELLELESKEEEKAIFDKEREKAQIVLGTKKETLMVLTRERARLQALLKEAIPFDIHKYASLISTLIESKTQEEVLVTKVGACKAEQASLELQKKQQSERKEKVFKLNHCPTCLQDVPSAHKHNILNEAETTLVSVGRKLQECVQIRKEAEEALVRQRAHTRRLEEEKAKADALRTKEALYIESKSKCTEIEKTLELLAKDIAFLTEHVLHLKESAASFAKFALLYTKKEQELRQALAEERTIDVLLAGYLKERALRAAALEKIEQALRTQKKLEEKAQQLSVKIDWLTGPFTAIIETIERQVLLNIRREFSKLLQQWFYSIAGEGFTVELDENFTPLIVHKGIEMEYGFLSGGERTALALAYRLALTTIINSLISTINTREIVILDEPTDGFSEYQIDKMREVLKEVACKQLILVSHEQKMEGFVDHVIRVTKAQGLSTIHETSSDLPQVLNTVQTQLF
jgi:exonuclease SbcC